MVIHGAWIAATSRSGDRIAITDKSRTPAEVCEHEE